jgi:hypothetical protein
MLGPIQFVAIGFDTIDRFNGQILEQLEELTDVPAVRVLDMLFVAKEDNGDLVALEGGELGIEGGDEALGTMLGALMGFSFDDEAESPPADITEASAIGVSVADIRRIGRDLAPGTAAALFLLEHRWAAGLRDALRSAGGLPVAQGFLTLEGLVLIGAELAATANAIAALEVADALEAEALIRSLELLTAIEMADELEAAVAAQAVRGLVDAGFIEQADAADAVAALVPDEMIQRALSQEGSA